MKPALVVLFISIVIASASCAGVSDQTGEPGSQESTSSSNSTPPADQTGNDSNQDNVDMANPASVYCVDQGGTLDIRDETNGQVGYCVFPDNSECEEWAYFRGECAPSEEHAGSQDSSDTSSSTPTAEQTGSDSNQDTADMANPASVYCVDQGGTLDIRDETDGQVGYCVFPDNSECEEWAYFRGECAPGGGDKAGMPNPASQYCIEQGGQLMMKTRGDGGEYGICYFEDNRQCEEWALMRGDCPVGGRKITGYLTDAAQYCAITGGEYTVTDESGAPEDEQGTCTFPNGTVCDVWNYYNGKCDPGTTDDTTGSDQAGAYVPLNDAACSDIAETMQEALTLDVTTAQAAFDDYISGASGQGCQATAVGSGSDFSSPAEASAILGALLESRGWEEDTQYQADGPTGTSTAYRQGDALCLSNIGWQPAEDTDCPSDQPISACDLSPDQQSYTATLNCAQK
jgi:hypothetical protein